jgi:hypothetical protein
MKAQQRKQLEQNELAAHLKRWWKGDPDGKSTGKPSPMFWAILGLIVLVGVLIFAWRYYADTAMRSRSELWCDFDLAAENTRLEQIMESNRGTPVALAAKAQMARGALQEGQDRLGSETYRTGAISNIEKAREWYEQLKKEAADDPQLQREAYLGMAKAEESLVGIPKEKNSQELRGSLDKARELYEETATKFPDTLQGKEAAKRAEEIKANKDKVLAFYQELNKTLTTTPPIIKLPDIKEPPPIPSLNPPTLPDNTTPKIDTPKPELAPLPSIVPLPPKTDTKPDSTPMPKADSTPPKADTKTPPK